jgi:lambda family phage tail tape measure protein
MADLKYRVEVDATNAQQNLKKLETSVGTTGSAFSQLKTVMGGLALGALAVGFFRTANELTDLSTAANISIQSILGLGQAFAANGGSVEKANASVLKFSQTIGDAAQEGKAALEAFARIGVTINDLRTLSEQDLLRKTIQGLSQINDTATRNKIAFDLLGRSVRGVDFRGLNNDFDGFVASSGASAESVAAAGRANQNFANSMQVFKIQLMAALAPISELALKLTDLMKAGESGLGKLLEWGVLIALFAGLAFLAGKFLIVLGALGTAFKAVGALVVSLIGALRFLPGLIRGIFNPVTRNSLRANMAELGGTLATKAKVMLEAMGVSTAALAKHWKLLSGAIGAAIYQFREFFGLGDAADGVKELSEQEVQIIREIDDAKAKAAADEAARQAKARADARAAFGDAINGIARTIGSYKERNKEQLKGLRFQIDSLNLSEKERAIVESRARLESEYNTEITQLRQRYSDIVNRGNEQEMRQLPLIAEAMKKLTIEYEKQIGEVDRLTIALQDAQNARELGLFVTREQIRLEDELQRIQNDIAKLTMTEIEQKYYDIEAAARASAKAAIEAEEARRNEKLSPAEAKAYYDAAMKGSERLKARHKELFDQSRTFSTGWKRAMNEYVANATNAARRAENIFKTATQGMEEAIVNFAKTGKFEWRNFVQMMLEELLRSQIQAVFAQLLGNMQGSMRGSSSGGGGGSSSSGGFLGSIVNLGSSLLKGVGSLFGGFFANGGTLGAGKWGIAGERGPEIISGPATITPMTGGGGTYVTYNINAVDAMSFKQLVAQDPGFMHAVVMQGARTAPMTRR